MNRILILIFALWCGATTAQNLKSGGILKPEQALMDIRHYKVVLEVDPAQQTIDGYTEISLITNKPTDILLFDLVHLMNVRKVWVNKKEQPFTHENDLINIALNSTMPAGKVMVKIEYGGKPGIAERPPWSGGFTWTTDSSGNPWVAITCQGEGAKIFFPCKDHPSDEPNEGAEMIITVPEGLYVAGPGLLQRSTTKSGKSTYQWKTNYTINNYSILFNIGKYKVATRTYTTVNGNKVPMQAYLLEEHFDKANGLLDIFERSARVQEKYFGEYPWVKEKMAVCESPHLGMEHQTLNAYGNKFNYTSVGGKDFDWLLHHEFGHEWWGNKVTGIDWAHMWIQEGICTFGDHLYTRDYEGEEAYIKRMQQTARNTQNKFPIVMGEQLDTDTVYHGDIYGKGAFFMHTLRYVIGDEIFFPTLKKLATDSKYTYNNLVHTNDVEELFSGASGQNLKPLFNFYLRTIQKLEVQVRDLGNSSYQVRLLNYEGDLPLEIVTGSGSQRMTLNKTGVRVTSSVWPVIDPKVYYLKRVILE
ncbi:MAG: M1 family metallopeptidase [Cyclobacteriaceae bacterium]|nr:M1 family metallopeptidase [Cyclobacteriaceae bacterium]